LLLRVRGQSASWLFRYAAASGRRREMGMGIAKRGSAAQAGDALTLARNPPHFANNARAARSIIPDSSALPRICW